MFVQRSIRASALALLALTISACGQAESPPPSSDEGRPVDAVAPAPGLEVATRLGVLNARMPLEGLVTAGQPTMEQLEALRDAGFENFISLRSESEDGAGWEEAHASSGGYDFDRLAITGAGSLTRENVEAFASLLDEAGDEPTVLYCASSNRVGALLALKAHWLDGATPEEALELGRAAGLTGLEGAVVGLLEAEGR